MTPDWFMCEANRAWADFLLKIAAGAGAIAAFSVGLMQYRKGQEWQKSAFVATLITEFEANPKMAAVRSMLDWDSRRISIGTGEPFDFDNEVFGLALRTSLTDSKDAGRHDPSPGTAEGILEFPHPQDKIRDALDAFFDFFEKVESYWALDLLTFEDLRYFYYWFESLRSIGAWKNDPIYGELLNQYLSAYHFEGTEHLLAEYRKIVRRGYSYPIEKSGTKRQT